MFHNFLDIIIHDLTGWPPFWEQTIKQLFAMGSELDTYFSIRSLLLHSMSFFVLFNLAYGVATPGGIFMPSIMV